MARGRQIAAARTNVMARDQVIRRRAIPVSSRAKINNAADKPATTRSSAVTRMNNQTSRENAAATDRISAAIATSSNAMASRRVVSSVMDSKETASNNAAASKVTATIHSRSDARASVGMVKDLRCAVAATDRETSRAASNSS